MTGSEYARRGFRMKEQLDVIIDQYVKDHTSFASAVQQFERTFIGKILANQRGNQLKAAGVLGIHRNTLSRKIEHLHLTVTKRAGQNSARAR